MSLYQRVIEQLEQLVIHGPRYTGTVIQKSPKGYIVGVPAGGKGIEASLNLEDYDRHSIILRHLEVVDNSIIVNGNAEDYLHQCAAEISQRLTYLEEPLVLLELNTFDSIALLRSSPPHQSAGETVYWEVKLWTTPHPRARLSRYGWTTGHHVRNPQLHPMTTMALARVAGDLAACLAGIDD